MSAPIIYIESNAALRRSMAEWLKSEGLEVTVFADGADAEHYLAGHTPEMVIANHYLTGTSGIEILARLRARGVCCPFVLFHISQDAQLFSLAESLKAYCLPLADCGTRMFVETLGRCLTDIARDRGFKMACVVG